MKKWLCILVLPVLFVLGSCATSKYTRVKYGDQIPDSLFKPINYLLRPGDKVTLQSFNNLSSVLYESTINNGAGGAGVPEYLGIVDNDGYIPLPRAGRVKVGGLTQKEATLLVNKAYEKIINNPEFDLIISTMKVNVLGAVNNQGSYVMTRENLTLADAFALAGGVKYENMSKKVMIIRNGVSMEFKLTPEEMGNPRLNAIIIKDNDVVMVKPSKASVNAPKISQYTAFLAPIGVIFTALSLYAAIQGFKK
jgi:polysaccharide export outer membrane protein